MTHDQETDHASQPLLLPAPHSTAQTFHRNWQRKIHAVGSGGRDTTRSFLTSRVGHCSVLGLVSLDVGSIIADFVISLFACERPASERERWAKASDALGVVSLVFSCLFVAELLAAVWAFGLRYFHSWFHCFDALVIVAGFVVDVLLHGVLEEVASLVVVLRLWRVFKIIEELSVGASERTEDLEQQLELLKRENRELRMRVQRNEGS